MIRKFENLYVPEVGWEPAALSWPNFPFQGLRARARNIPNWVKRALTETREKKKSLSSRELKGKP
jgi:hypothetical protein